MRNRFTIENLRKLTRDPTLFFEEMRRLNRFLNSRIYNQISQSGFDVIDEDWDTLMILDGCRFQQFKEMNYFEGELSCITSKGAHSFEFMEKTFGGRQLHDTVYITANPWIEHFDDLIFYTTKTTYTDDNRGGKMRLPEDVAQLALDTFEEYPNKRYIVHFMQPNNPYIGPKAAALREKVSTERSIFFTEMGESNRGESSDYREELPHLRSACKKGYISKVEMMEIYEENLEIVLSHAERVIDELGGKTAVTGDHGDMFGERLPPLFLREYSHWRNVYTDVLRHVPWLVIDSDSRRKVRAETPIGFEKIDMQSVQDQLKTMGYLN